MPTSDKRRLPAVKRCSRHTEKISDKTAARRWPELVLFVSLFLNKYTDELAILLSTVDCGFMDFTNPTHLSNFLQHLESGVNYLFLIYVLLHRIHLSSVNKRTLSQKYLQTTPDLSVSVFGVCPVLS